MIAVLSRSLGRQCGISEYAVCLAQRLGGVAVKSVEEIPSGSTPVFIQYEPSLYRGIIDLLNEISTIEGFPIIDVHTEIPVDIVPVLTSVLGSSAIVGVKRGPREGAWFLPLISYAPVGDYEDPPDEIRLGTFGFAVPNKNYEQIIELALRLHVPLTILAAVANATPGIEVLSKAYVDYLRMMSHSSPDVEVIDDFLTHEQIVSKLRECSHLICAMDDLDRTSASMRMMALAGRPIISTPCAGAEEVGAVVVDSLSDIILEFLSRDLPLPSFPDGLDQYLALLHSLEVHV